MDEFKMCAYRFAPTTDSLKVHLPFLLFPILAYNVLLKAILLGYRLNVNNILKIIFFLSCCNGATTYYKVNHLIVIKNPLFMTYLRNFGMVLLNRMPCI